MFVEISTAFGSQKQTRSFTSSQHSKLEIHMPQVKVTYGGNVQHVFVELDDVLELFRIQILSLFDVDVSEQRFSLAALHTSPETTSLRQLGWNEESTIEVSLTREKKAYQPTNQDAQFLARVQSSYSHVKQYSDGKLQQAARETIPIAELERLANESRAKTGGDVSFRDSLLLELLHWFKKDFFKWVNAPDCGNCGGAGDKTMKSCGAVMPSAEERADAAGVTEIYQCSACNCQTRFPRYNSLKKLLTWRKGRCGEFSNCFTLCCIAMGFEARHVVDWTDHVWTEVWSESQQRWLHCDSCEDKCDIPAIYESGWGKKLNYCIAFAETHIVDVTRRYTRKWEEVVTRRTLINEELLQTQIQAANEQIAAMLEPERLVILFERMESERKELDSPPPENPQGLEGRVSGSLEWKILRGEAGPQNK